MHNVHAPMVVAVTTFLCLNRMGGHDRIKEKLHGNAVNNVIKRPHNSKMHVCVKFAKIYCSIK